MKDAFWGQIFCLLSAGGATIETIRQYIKVTLFLKNISKSFQKSS